MIKKIFLLVSFSFFLVTINAQVCQNLDAGDDIQMLCTDDSEVQLTAIVNNPNYKSTTDYSIGGELLCPSIPHEGQRANLQTDDAWINFVLDMPFSFCFFGNQYDQLLVSANGVITFDTSVVGDFHVWLTETNELPNQIYQTNAIFGPYHDMDPSIQPRGDRIVAQTLGVAPNRTFVVSFECRQFGCNELESKSKIILYESSNVIDIFVEVKDICTTWEDGKGLVGIQNKFATVGYSPVGREQGAWTPTSGGELWRFMPNGEELDYTLIWYDTNDMNTPLNADNGEVINVIPQAETTYVVQLEYIDDCSDDLVFLQDTITITPGFTPDLAEPVDLTECEDPIGSGTFDFNIDQTVLVLNNLNPADFIISYHNSLSDMQSNINPILILNPYTATQETIYIRVEDINDATCVTFRDFDILALPILDTSFTYDSSNYCDNNPNPLPNAVANVATYTINNGGVINAETGEIDLAASGLGNDGTGVFTITHDINICSPPASQFQITIELSEDPSFEYPATACLSEVTNPTAFDIITAGGIFTIDDNTVTINLTTGEIDLTTVTANTIYNITYSLAGICPSASTNTIEILDDDASFTYPNTNYCNDDGTNPSPTATVLGGVYTINNGGTIDSVTGEVDLAISGLGNDNSGNFIITYTITECGTSTPFSITIEITEDPGFEFPSQVCIDDIINPIAFNIMTVGGIFSVLPNDGATISATGELDLSTTTAGTSYIISYDFDGNCPSGDTQTITIVAEDNSSFDYATNLYCNDGVIDPVAQNIATAGGTFSINNGGVLIDSTTGEINLSDSALGDNGTGIFIVTYTTPDPCSTSSEFMITIQLTNDANFDYISDICSAEENPKPEANSFIAGGTFSVDLGASINSATGELDLSTVTENVTYTITYSFGGLCSSDETNQILINESPIANIPTSDFILECDIGDGTANFDVSDLIDEISTTDTVTFYNSESDAVSDTNSLSLNPLVTNGLDVWVRVENTSGCFVVQNVSEFLRVQQCFLVIPEGFSPNSETVANQNFTIRLNNGELIKTLYPDFKLFIYNRYGKEVYVGNASETDWNGTVDNNGEELPVGTYFYGIKLNDLNAITYRGWVYLQR